jgi:hypothetical protein
MHSILEEEFSTADGRRLSTPSPLSGYFTNEQEDQRIGKWYRLLTKYGSTVAEGYRSNAVYQFHRGGLYGKAAGLMYSFGEAAASSGPKTEEQALFDLATLVLGGGGGKSSTRLHGVLWR